MEKINPYESSLTVSENSLEEQMRILRQKLLTFASVTTTVSVAFYAARGDSETARDLLVAIPSLAVFSYVLAKSQETKKKIMQMVVKPG